MHFPQNWPHWVKNGPSTSISLSITFRTRESQRHEHVHSLNAHLRRRGMHPRPAGTSPTIDRIKAAPVGAVRRLRGLSQRGPHISR